MGSVELYPGATKKGRVFENCPLMVLSQVQQPLLSLR